MGCCFVRGSQPVGMSTGEIFVFAASFCTMRRFLCLKNFGRPCRAPNPEVGCEPGGVIHVLFENPSLSRFFLCILQSSAGNRIGFMPLSRKFLQRFPRHRRLIDNGPMEGFWGILKRARYYGKRLTSKQELVRMIQDYIYYYNTQRVQRNLGVVTPMEKYQMAFAA